MNKTVFAKARFKPIFSAAVAKLNEEGFDEMNITEIMSGSYCYKYNSEGITSSKRI